MIKIYKYGQTKSKADTLVGSSEEERTENKKEIKQEIISPKKIINQNKNLGTSKEWWLNAKQLNRTGELSRVEPKYIDGKILWLLQTSLRKKSIKGTQVLQYRTRKWRGGWLKGSTS